MASSRGSENPEGDRRPSEPRPRAGDPSGARSLRFRLGRAAGVAWRVARPPLLAYLLVLVIAMLLENRMIFFPAAYPLGDWRPAGLAPEDAWFEAPDGTKLHGWYLPRENPRAVVLFCHGNAGNITHRTEILRALDDVVGVSTLVFDYRGYGRSEGRPDEAGVLADARAARAWLARRAGIPQDRIVLMGESLGGAVAVDLAAEEGASALVLENTFNNLRDLAAYHYPWLPVRWLLRSRFDAAQQIRRYHGPLFQSHGDCDTIVPYALGRKLFAEANEPKQFLTIPGGDHNDLHSRQYYLQLRAFVERLP